MSSSVKTEQKDNINSNYAHPGGIKESIKELEIPLDKEIKKFKQIKKLETNNNNDLTNYNEVIKIIIEVRQKRDTTTHNINSFNIDMKNALKEKGFKINYYGKNDSKINFGLIKIYKDNLSMNIDCKTFELSCYNNYNFNNNMNDHKEVQYYNGELYPNYNDILQIKKLDDGTTFFVSFDNFKKEILVTTTKNLLGNIGTNYDGVNHKDFFIKECNKKGYDLNLILNYFIENNLNNMVMVFTLRHFSTPIPLDVEENTMEIVDVYQINNNIEILSKIDENYTNWKTSKFKNEDFVKNIDSLISNISEFIVYYDLNDFVSFCNNNNLGLFNKKKEYDFDKDKDISTQFSIFFNNCSNKFKGFLIYTPTNIEIVYNDNYMQIFNMRPNISLNLLENNDKIINRLLFKFQLKLYYKQLPKEKFYENYSYLVKKFKIDEYLKENTRKVNEWQHNLIELYNDIYITKKKDKMDIPNCYKYKTDNQFYKDFIYMIHTEYKINSSNKYGKKDIKDIVKEIIYVNVLYNYFDNSNCIYGEMYGKIMTPDMRTKRSITKINNNRTFMLKNDI
jgi:hypothetical protein